MDADQDGAPELTRAQWLSELNRAIDEAQWLAWRIGVVEGRNAQALELYVHLEMLRAEVEAMRTTALSSRDLKSLGNLSSTREGLEE